jgi:hypothetical protein
MELLIKSLPEDPENLFPSPFYASAQHHLGFRRLEGMA